MKRDSLLEEAKSSNNEPDWVKYRNQRDHVSVLKFSSIAFLLKDIKLLIFKNDLCHVYIQLTGSESD